MALPIGPYQGQDLTNYEAGNKFLPREFYSLNSTIPSPIQTNTIENTGGITGTQATGSYMGYPSYEEWLLAQGGADSGSGSGNITNNRGGINQNLGPTNITDYESEAYGVGPTFKGSVARLQDLYSRLPTPGNLLMRGIRKWRENREIKKEQKRIAEDRTGIGDHDRGTFEGPHPDRPTKTPEQGGWHPGVGGNGGGTGSPGGGAQAAGDEAGGSSMSSPFKKGGRIGYGLGDIVKGWFSGGPESETNPTLFGTQNSLMNKTAIDNLENAIGLYETQIENADQLGHLSKEDMLKYELAKKQLEALIAGSKGQAEGGLIGYFDGGIVRLL